MSAPGPTPSATDDADSLDSWERALLDRQLEALGRLADMGMAMAAAIERRATAEEPGPNAVLQDADLHHAAMDFARVSRAVRMTFALQSRLIADFKGRPQAPSAEAEEPHVDAVVWQGDRPHRGVVQRREIRGLVRRVARAGGLDDETVERLSREARERLEADEFHHILMTRSRGEVLALICADLGLEPDWEQLSGDAWAQHEIARRPRGSPFIAWMAQRAQGEQRAPAPPALVPSG
jgi:hypothetical protein